MVGKKGFIRTIEAVIAILLIFGFIIVMRPNLANTKEPGTPKEIQTLEKFVFSKMVYDKELRECITIENPPNPSTGNCREVCVKLDDFLSENKPYGYEYKCEICTGPVSCLSEQLPIDRDIYANSIFLAAKNSNKIVRVYYFPE